MTDALAEPLKTLMIRLIQAHDEEGLTAQEAAELMMDAIRSDSCYSGCGGRKGSWNIPEVPPRHVLTREILYLQEKGFEQFREYCIETPEYEAGRYIPLLLRICESWNKTSHSAMKKLKDGYHEYKPIFLSLKEARQIENLGKSIKEVLEDSYSLGKWRWAELAAELEGTTAEERDCLPDYSDTPRFWKRVLCQTGGKKYKATEAGFVFDKRYEEKLQRDIVSRQEMAAMSYLQLMEIHGAWQWNTCTEWNERIQIEGQTAAEFMILLTTMWSVEFTLFPEEEDSEEDDSDQSVKTEEEHPVITLCEEEAAEKYTALALIFSAFQDFHVRTSGRWRGILDLEDKDLQWPCIRPKE